MVESLSLALTKSLICDREALARAVAYAVDHATNVLRHRRVGEVPTAPVVFDWLSQIASEFESVPAGFVKLRGNGLWLSRRVVVNFETVGSAIDREAEERLRRTPAPASELRSVLVEMDFTRGLFERMIRDPAFEAAPMFGSREAFVARLLHHARSTGKPLKRLELLHESAFSSGGSMAPPCDRTRNSPPWERTWRRPAEDREKVRRAFSSRAFARALTFRGQRRLAVDLIERSPEPRDRDLAKAAWTLGAGGNAEVRAEAIAASPEFFVFPKAKTVAAWASFLVPWVDPRFFDDSDAGPPIEKHPQSEIDASVASFFVVAAVLDAAPEGNECPVHAWEGTEANLGRVARDRPHLSGVVEKVLRYRRDYAPPRRMIEKIVEETRRFEARGCGAHDRETVRKSCVAGHEPATVVARLESEGCHADAAKLAAFAKNGGVRVFEFGEGGDVSRVDVAATPALTDGKQSTAVFGDRKYYLGATRDALDADGGPIVRKHPLSALRHDLEHPLASTRQDLVVRCVSTVRHQ
jgi:hypothetical protein